MCHRSKASKLLLLVLTLLIVVSLACNLPTAITPPVTVTAEESANVVWATIYEDTSVSYPAQISIGKPASVVAHFKPVVFHWSRRSDGYIGDTGWSSWDSHTVAEMQMCVSLDEPCQLTGKWLPFSSNQEFTVDVDWIGPRSFWVVAQFRDADGRVIPSVGESRQEPEDHIQDEVEIIGTLDEATPITAQPPAVQTAVATTREAFPVRGSVEIEDGICCVGGTEGDVIDVGVTFEASSPFAEVTEMRVSTRCRTEGEMADLPWEPFVSEQSYSVHVLINWTGFYISVQYRDAQGNLSPVYCDDISVEGHPKPP
ncbi:MAG: hypothetical protein SWK90_01330 [Chloroflexota bacterium]|nr:hypothetical protein [Chloroflexota bacterium]